MTAHRRGPPPCPPLLYASGVSVLQRQLMRQLAAGARRVPLGLFGEFRRLSLHDLERRGGVRIWLDWDSGRAVAELTEHGHAVWRDILAGGRSPLTAAFGDRE